MATLRMAEGRRTPCPWSPALAPSCLAERLSFCFCPFVVVSAPDPSFSSARPDVVGSGDVEGVEYVFFVG
jgi:hypothetical protein